MVGQAEPVASLEVEQVILVASLEVGRAELAVSLEVGRAELAASRVGAIQVQLLVVQVQGCKALQVVG